MHESRAVAAQGASRRHLQSFLRFVTVTTVFC